MGMSNRLLAGRARRVCLAFPLPGRDGPRYVVTGRPVPPRVADRAAARAALRIGAEERCVLVFGGSLGARSLNHAAVAAFADAPYRVLHVAGRRDFPDLAAPGPHYDLRDYLTPFGQALAAADLAVARAGGSIFELAQYGLPAVLVPYPHATADHQTANARWMVDGGAATVIADATLTPEGLRAAVDAILVDPARLGAMAAASARLARPEAARDVAREVLTAAGGPSA
jgi:UDP-N-acetylglucosamine--N-acetylmuramyl-(pentapeptide) pyrophosphoryl-undecaprenol N-acetylglucosamine transferase